MNLANLFEPLAVDDVCHLYYAEQVARAPLQPFEFDLVWHQKPVPAWDVMVAPVNSYYWAPAVWLFGGAGNGSPIAWKLWFLPVQFLFCWSLLHLLRRVAPRHAGAFLVMLALGPAVLPGLNLMLELPMLALGFASLEVLLRASQQRRLALALLAGVLWGLAFQTKYSAMGFFGPWLLVTVLHDRLREFLIGFVVAAATAAGIEWLVSLSHGGGSYFLRQLELSQTRDWPHKLRGLFAHFGMLAAVPAMLALWAMAVPRWLWWGLGLLLVAGLAEVALSGGAPDPVAYLLLPLATWAVFGALGWRLLQRARRGFLASRWRPSLAFGLGLVLWIVSEALAALVVSPFPAARRALLTVVAATFVVAWFASRRPGAARAIPRAAAAAALLGFGFQAIDLLEGRAVTAATAAAAERVRDVAPGTTAWFTGGWAFEFYAPRAGLQPFLRDVSELQPGDHVLIGSIDGYETPWFVEDDPSWLERVARVAVVDAGDPVPWSLLFGYYSGRRPLELQQGPRYSVRIYRALVPIHANSLRVAPNPWRDG